MRHILTAMVMPEGQALGDVLPKRPKGSADSLADGLQSFKPGPLLGGMDAYTLCRAMIDRDKDGNLPVLMRVCRRHIRPPHRIDLRGNDRPIMGFGTMWMALPRGGQQTGGPHEAQHPAWRRAETAMSQACPHLAVPFAGERRRFQDAPDMVHQ